MEKMNMGLEDGKQKEVIVYFKWRDVEKLWDDWRCYAWDQFEDSK